MAVNKMEIDAIWTQYAQTKDEQLKNELLLNYLPLVRNIVLRMMPSYSGYNDYDDLISCGVLGLMDAIEKYDLARQVKFETYATMRIRGEIIDHMRKQDWAPASLRRKINRVSEAYSELELKLFRPPTEDEVARHLEMTIQDVQKVLEKSHVFNVLHFEDMMTENYADSALLQNEEYAPSASVEKNEIKVILGEIIDALPENEKTVISLYYFEEMTLKEIAQVLKVSESRVSQIHSKVLIKLRNRLQNIFIS